jgi:hypothetical protein
LINASKRKSLIMTHKGMMMMLMMTHKGMMMIITPFQKTLHI